MEVAATRVALQQIAGLRGRRLKAYEEFEILLAAAGCAAMGYRLTGGPPLDSLCVKHLRGADRVVVAFVDSRAVVLLVGPHAEGDKAADVYSQLYEIVGVDPPEEERSKPPCCGDDSAPPDLDEVDIDVFLGAR